ncbi:putative S-adenosylmethionine-dependent methyltransferase CRG1 [Cytospora mali]|uniref:S-adenosylmethionine-dependent methyltransferase CRG1 n=1 Tax=Cytospora mali TaxID=578113 RepID=A0A194VA03_CYTMA|nr:putative S-adenosylmethionine-dependent methyltransferase CRG1 [Valsa mali var. pyri (nom. inval.)]
MGSYTPDPPTALEEAHETHETRPGKREVKYPFAFKNLDWEEYHCYRPRYPDSMLKMWLSYHKEHGNGRFHWAHDMGAGPGTVARRLGPYFNRILVSDAGRANIRCAKDILASPSPPAFQTDLSKYVFLNSPAESVHISVPPSSIDFACVAMAFHYFDAEAAIRSIATMLKPGGTLAAVTYGFRLKFPGRPELERLWYQAASKESLRLIREGLFPAAVRGLANAMSGLDFVPIPTDFFKSGARRIQVNVDEDELRPLCFVDEDKSCWEPAPSRVNPTDIKMFVKDDGWRREADVEWLKGFLASCKMGFDHKTWETDKWKEFEAVVRSAGGKVTVEWPVAIVLATRNDRPVVW